MLYVGRENRYQGWAGHRFANPYKLKPSATIDDRRSLIRKYAAWLDQEIYRGPATFAEEIKAMWGKTLGCWCHPQMCHAHWLAHTADLNLAYLHGREMEPKTRLAAGRLLAAPDAGLATEFVKLLVEHHPALVRQGDLAGLTEWEIEWWTEGLHLLLEAQRMGNGAAWKAAFRSAMRSEAELQKSLKSSPVS